MVCVEPSLCLKFYIKPHNLLNCIYWKPPKHSKIRLVLNLPLLQGVDIILYSYNRRGSSRLPKMKADFRIACMPRWIIVEEKTRISMSLLSCTSSCSSKFLMRFV